MSSGESLIGGDKNAQLEWRSPARLQVQQFGAFVNGSLKAPLTYLRCAEGNLLAVRLRECSLAAGVCSNLVAPPPLALVRKRPDRGADLS
jgi:hypothetical protein